MTQNDKAAVCGPVTITLSGPQGSGKTRLAAAIRAALEANGNKVVAYGPAVPVVERRWRKLYSAETAQVMLVECQGDAEAESSKLLETLKAARAVLTSILGDETESRIIAEQVSIIDAAISKAEVAA